MNRIQGAKPTCVVLLVLLLVSHWRSRADEDTVRNHRGPRHCAPLNVVLLVFGTTLEELASEDAVSNHR